MYPLRLESPFRQYDMTISAYDKKKKEVLKFIKDNTGKYKGTEIFWYCGLYKAPFDTIVDDLEKEGLIKWNRNKQSWNYVSNYRGKS